MGACLPTRTDNLIRLMLAALAADDHGDINVILVNVRVITQIVVNQHLDGDSR